MEKASWLYNGDIFNCEISHDVDGFGQYKITAYPGDELIISLHSDWLRLFDTTSDIYIESSAWQQQHNKPFTHSELTWRGSFAHTSRNSRAFLEALEQGQTWQANIAPINGVQYQVNSTPVSTRSAVRQFRLCQQELLPKPFSYVRRVDLTFDSNSSKLDADIEQDLIAISRYISADPTVTEVLVDGHADDSGDRFINLQLSKERALEVQSRLIELGVSVNMIQVRHHGSRNPIATNNAQGRELNRRVMVRLVKGTTKASSKTAKVSQ
ncbi:OmpA family protein [Shewanella sp. 4_MG-2023]|uniref:MotY family protein n=1 Tax=Shewanella sp. 4_MG-2023 TaxID=3062652 RepID=UPI0026E40262|nr:OmpA family protein [Shewanella sp. 4_MG-2023]MDO6680263.1 OmpA family protein [Shewanella sp. 4_MG-2023]